MAINRQFGKLTGLVASAVALTSSMAMGKELSGDAQLNAMRELGSIVEAGTGDIQKVARAATNIEIAEPAGLEGDRYVSKELVRVPHKRAPKAAIR